MIDHLDRETSVGVDVTVTGMEAKAKSRLVAAVDRLGGNLIELVNAPIERKLLRQRAVAAGEVEFIAAVTRFGVEKLHYDPKFAERAAEKYFQRVFEKQENKDGVLREALEDLRHEPPHAIEAGQTRLDDQFLDRLEHYAESASTEQLRQKWGRVLSAEVRKPGTFSAKVMRIVDELDPNAAALFENLCKFVIGEVAPKCLATALPFGEIVQLVSAGLIIEPGFAGHVAEWSEARSVNGDEVWWFQGSERAISIPKNVNEKIPAIAFLDSIFPLQLNPATVEPSKSKPAIPCYLLTDVGASIARIFPANNAFAAYIAKLKEAHPDIGIVECVPNPDGITYRSVESTGA